MKILPLALAFVSSAANAVRRRNRGLRPMVTSASAPDLMKTRRFMMTSLPALEFRRSERERHDLCEAIELPWRALPVVGEPRTTPWTIRHHRRRVIVDDHRGVRRRGRVRVEKGVP